MIVERSLDQFVQLPNGSKALGDRNDRRRNVPGLVVVGVNWCGYCKRLKESLQTTDSITQARLKLREGFPFYWIDGDANPKALEVFAGSGYPTVYFVNSAGVVDKKAYEGSRDPEILFRQLVSRS